MVSCSQNAQRLKKLFISQLQSTFLSKEQPKRWMLTMHYINAKYYKDVINMETFSLVPYWLPTLQDDNT